ncbi:LptA/OstA family protein [Telmatospirillum sp.]|uniref:LptA/OstA family protein n=1 Tax=Telmatospirillum sp. TaxID=2079197 RepID=UPI002843601B|nr:LptA/OstA family protein [Telmatospirillum sp.]MDR3439541.1 LptA/OstA family protein [Telmatospirillum sp.]
MALGRACLVLMTALCLAGLMPADAKNKPSASSAAKPAATATPAPTGTGGGLDFADQKSGTPLEIYADQGLELSQDAKSVIARVNAKAIRGRVTVLSDVLTAFYRDKQPVAAAQQPSTAASAATNPPPPPPSPPPSSPSSKPGKGKSGEASEGGTEVWRVEAEGHVAITTQTQTAYGDHADYNIDDAVVKITGKDLKLLTPTDVVTARDSLEYWERPQQAVARGNAVAVRGEKRIQADTLVADFAQNADKQMAMQRAHAYDHVILTTAREVVTGDRGEYNVETGIVTLTGSVKITRDENQLDGGYAVVNLNTGISRIYPAAPGSAEKADQRVKGLFMPQKRQPGSQGAGASSDPSPGTP